MMELILLLFAGALLCSCETQGSSAVTSVFVQTGDDVLLNVTKTEGFDKNDIVVWRFKIDNNLVRFLPSAKPIVSAAYTGRIEFPQRKYSVKLKNLQHADSGVYTARVTGDKEQTVAEYNITVEDPVSPVELTVDCRSYWNLTVTCSTQDSLISSTFRCDNQTCSHQSNKRGARTYSSSITVYLEQDFIICNHTNRVSLQQAKKKIKSFCVPPPVSAGVITAVTVSVLVIVLVAAFVAVMM